MAGDMSLDREALTCPTDPDQQLVILTAEPGTPCHEGLRFLRSGTAALSPVGSGPTGEQPQRVVVG
ncbi:hypothetical protein [Streptomyces sp. NPDC093109]|uniref:hypothetical protein n=1 Tax=Streptomyces sp. NPDC093109 TaxID=3154977 RepID=UPI00344B5263